MLFLRIRRSRSHTARLCPRMRAGKEKKGKENGAKRCESKLWSVDLWVIDFWPRRHTSSATYEITSCGSLCLNDSFLPLPCAAAAYRRRRV